MTDDRSGSGSSSSSNSSSSSSSSSSKPGEHNDNDNDNDKGKRRQTPTPDAHALPPTAIFSPPSTSTSTSTSTSQLSLSQQLSAKAQGKRKASPIPPRKREREREREREHEHHTHPATLLSTYTCPICLSPPTDAVTTTCGHLFCGDCLFKHLKTEAGKNSYPRFLQHPHRLQLQQHHWWAPPPSAADPSPAVAASAAAAASAVAAQRAHPAPGPGPGRVAIIAPGSLRLPLPHPLPFPPSFFADAPAPALAPPPANDPLLDELPDEQHIINLRTELQVAELAVRNVGLNPPAELRGPAAGAPLGGPLFPALDPSQPAPPRPLSPPLPPPIPPVSLLTSQESTALLPQETEARQAFDSARSLLAYHRAHLAHQSRLLNLQNNVAETARRLVRAVVYRNETRRRERMGRLYQIPQPPPPTATATATATAAEENSSAQQQPPQILTFARAIEYEHLEEQALVALRSRSAVVDRLHRNLQTSQRYAQLGLDRAVRTFREAQHRWFTLRESIYRSAEIGAVAGLNAAPTGPSSTATNQSDQTQEEASTSNAAQTADEPSGPSSAVPPATTTTTTTTTTTAPADRPTRQIDAADDDDSDADEVMDIPLLRHSASVTSSLRRSGAIRLPMTSSSSSIHAATAALPSLVGDIATATATATATADIVPELVLSDSDDDDDDYRDDDHDDDDDDDDDDEGLDDHLLRHLDYRYDEDDVYGSDDTDMEDDSHDDDDSDDFGMLPVTSTSTSPEEAAENVRRAQAYLDADRARREERDLGATSAEEAAENVRRAQAHLAEFRARERQRRRQDQEQEDEESEYEEHRARLEDVSERVRQTQALLAASEIRIDALERERRMLRDRAANATAGAGAEGGPEAEAAAEAVEMADAGAVERLRQARTSLEASRTMVRQLERERIVAPDGGPLSASALVAAVRAQAADDDDDGDLAVAGAGDALRGGRAAGAASAALRARTVTGAGTGAGAEWRAPFPFPPIPRARAAAAAAAAAAALPTPSPTQQTQMMTRILRPEWDAHAARVLRDGRERVRAREGREMEPEEAGEVVRAGMGAFLRSRGWAGRVDEVRRGVVGGGGAGAGPLAGASGSSGSGSLGSRVIAGRALAVLPVELAEGVAAAGMEAVQPAPSSSSSAHPAAAPAPAQASYPDVGEGPAWLTTDRRTQLEALRATIHRACFAATSANDAIRHLRDVYRQVEFGNQAPVRVHGQPPSLDSAPRPGSVSSRVRWRPRTDGDDVLFSDEDEDWILSSGDEMESNADADAGAGAGPSASAQPETERRTRIPARLVGRLTMLADELRDALELVDVDSLTSPGGDVDVGRGLTAAVATATTRAAAAASAASSSGEMVNASTTSNSTPSLRTNAIEVAQGRNGEAQLRTMLARNGIAADLIERYVAAFRAVQTSSSSQPGFESSTDSGTMATAILFSAVNLLQGTTFEAVSSGLAFSTSTAAAAGDPAPAGAAEPEREASMRQHLTMVGASAQRIELAVLAFRRAPSSSASASGSASASAPVAGSSSAAAAAAITPREETLQNGEVNMRIALTEQGYDAARIERHAQAYRSLTTGTGGSSRTAGSAPTTSTVTPFASRRVGGGGGGADVGATPFGATPVGTPASSSRNAAGAVDTEASTRSGNDSTRDARFTTHPQLFTFGAGARARGTAGEAGSSGETFPFSFQLPARTAVATSSSPSALPAAAGDGDDGQLTPLGRWSRIHELADRGQTEDSIRAARTSTNGGTSSAPRPTAGGSTASSSEFWRARRSSLARSRGRRLRPGSVAAAAGEPGHRPDINFVARMPASVVAGGGDGAGLSTTSMPASASSSAPVPAPNPASVPTSASSDLPTSSSTSGSTTAVASGPSSGDVGPEPTAITNLLRSLGDETLRSTSAYASAVAVFGNAATVLAEDAAVLRGRPRQLQIQLLNNIIDMLNIRRELTRRQLEDVENPSGVNDGGAASATTTSSTSPPSGSRTTLAAALRLYQDTVNRFERTRTELERGTAARREEERALLRERELTVQAQRAALTASHIASRDRAVNASNAGSGSAGATRAQPTEQRLAPGERWNSLAGGTCPMCRSAISGFNVDCDPLPRGRSTTTTATGESASPFTLGLTSSSMSTTTAIVNGRSTTASSSRDRLAPIRALRGLRFSVGIPADQADFIQSSAMAAAMAAEEVERDADTAEPAAKRVKREFGDAPFRGLGKANGKVPESINPRLTTTDAAGFSRPVPSPAGVGAAATATATATDATPATINPSRLVQVSSVAGRPFRMLPRRAFLPRRDDAMTAAGAVARSEDSIAGAVLADVVLEAAAPAQPASSSRRALAPNVLHGQTQDGSSSTAAIVLDDDSDDLNDELDAVVMVAATVDLLAARRERELPSSENDPLSPLNHVRTPGFAPSGGAQLAPLPAREEGGGIAVGESSSAPNRNEEQVASMRLLRRPGSGTVGVSAAGASSSSSSSSSITPLPSRTGSDEDGADSTAANGNNAAPLTRPRKRRRTADDDGEEDRLVDEAIRYGHLPSI